MSVNLYAKMALRLSVVISTFNRLPLLMELLDALGKQSISTERFEVVVVDDGSKIPAAPELEKRADPFPLTVHTQANAGAAAARHFGITKANGDIVVITDDDMLVNSDFLAQHLAAHEAGHTLVLGQIAADTSLAEKPLFERFHAQQLEKFVTTYRDQPTAVIGVMVCTGNVSFRRQDYLEVGGFDMSLGRSEDRELGLRLQKAGAKLYFAENAITTHRSDHADLEVWMRRNFNYGVYDSRIHHKHPELISSDPWYFLSLVNPVSGALLFAAATAPQLGFVLARAAYKTAEVVDGARTVHPFFGKVALAGATLSYGLEYFRGVRNEAGSLRQTLKDLTAYLQKKATDAST
jgi:GT2 family glycosyltransferase